MAFQLGTSSPDALRLGTQSVTALLLGTTAIWAATSVATDPAVTAVDSDGWRVTHSSPPGEFDPIGDPRVVEVSRHGFDATGAPVRVPDTLTLLKRVRTPFPNQAILTPFTASLSDFVFAGDTILENGQTITNNSTRAYPQPGALWLRPDMEWVRTNTWTARLAVSHAFARNARPVAAVRFTVSDGVNSISATVSAMSTITFAASGLTVPHFAADLDLTGLDQATLITVDATIFPWVGEAFTISTDAETYPSPNLTTLRLFNDSGDTFGASYAFVDGVGGGTPAVSTDPATARTTPYASVAAAASALRLFNQAAFGRDSGSGGVIRLEPGTHALDDFSSVPVGDVPLVIELAELGTTATTMLTDPGGSLSDGITDRLIIRGLTLRRNASGNVIFLDSKAQAGSANLLVLENCAFDDAGLGPSWGAWLYQTGRTWLINCGGVDCGQAGIFSSAFKSIIAIGSGAGSIGKNTYHAAGVRDVDATQFELIEATVNKPESRGIFLGWSHIANGGSNVRVVDTRDRDPGPRGMHIVGCVLEHFGTGAPALQLWADGDTTPVGNIVVTGTTVVGQRTNFLYQDAGAARIDKSGAFRFTVHQERNTKSDVFAGDGTLIGNWPVIYQVGSLANAALAGSSDDDAPGIGSWLGEVATPGDVHGEDAAPLEPLWTDDRSAEGSGGGGGDYTPGPGSPLPVIPAGLAPWSHDMLGRAIANDGTARIGALQPA